MQMRPQIQIKSVVKALTDVVLPALDPHNKPAQEQVRLAIGTLQLMAAQLPLQFRFDCDELARLIAFSDVLQRLARGGPGTQAALGLLAELSRSAALAFDTARIDPAEVEQWVRALRAASSALITQVYRDGDPACRTSIRTKVLAMSEEQLLRDRSWLLMQGWEPDPAAVPSITTLLPASPR